MSYSPPIRNSTTKRAAKTDNRHSKLAPLIHLPTPWNDEDVLVEVAEHVYPVDFVILDIKENENRPFILGTPFLTTAKALMKCDTGTNNLNKIKLHLEREMQFNQWRSKNFKGKHPTLIATKEGMDDGGEVTQGRVTSSLATRLVIIMMKEAWNSLEFHWMDSSRKDDLNRVNARVVHAITGFMESRLQCQQSTEIQTCICIDPSMSSSTLLSTTWQITPRTLPSAEDIACSSVSFDIPTYELITKIVPLPEVHLRVSMLRRMNV
ncbi:zinc finger, CCHC-type containing protein [Tanacetum coccineum]